MTYFLPTQVKIARLLVKHGADPNLRNDDDKSPFALASCAAMREVLVMAQQKKYVTETGQDGSSSDDGEGASRTINM